MSVLSDRESRAGESSESAGASAAAEMAFAALMDRHGPMVWGVCHRVPRDVPATADAFQATFLVLIRKAGSVRVDDSLGGWHYGVAYRLALRAQGPTIPGRMRLASSRHRARG